MSAAGGGMGCGRVGVGASESGFCVSCAGHIQCSSCRKRQRHHGQDNIMAIIISIIKIVVVVVVFGLL